MEDFMLFFLMVFLGGWLSGFFTCWMFVRGRRNVSPVRIRKEKMIQTEPAITPGVCDLVVFPTGAKYHLPQCKHVQRRPRNASLLQPCLNCFSLQLEPRDA